MGDKCANLDGRMAGKEDETRAMDGPVQARMSGNVRYVAWHESHLSAVNRIQVG